MRLNGLLKCLKDIKKKCKGNPEVLFDTEAALFPCHWVDINEPDYIPSDMSPDGRPFVSVCYNYRTTPCWHLTQEVKDKLKKSGVLVEKPKRAKRVPKSTRKNV